MYIQKINNRKIFTRLMIKYWSHIAYYLRKSRRVCVSVCVCVCMCYVWIPMKKLTI